ncbi:MAG TPA: hypothetical protein VMU22_15800 [Rhizomicrobium sp.]|nr:hypothetical protein [Rhizomicrobium sp.]
MTPKGLDEFLERLDLYGGSLAAWPVEARAEAEALLARSPDARAHLVAMQRVESALAQTRMCDTGDDLAFRATQARQARPEHAVMRQLPWAVAGMVAIAAGLYVGALPRISEGPSEIVSAALDQSGGHDVW